MKQFLTAVALLSASTAAFAQDSRDLRVRVGVGAQVRPDYIGSDHSEVAPLVHVNIAHGNDPFKFGAPDDRFGIAVVSNDGFRFGPAANIEGSRKDSDVGAPVGKVKTTLEAGAFAEYYPTPSIRLRAEALKGIGGHKGIVGSVGVDQVWRDGDRYVFSIGPRILLSDARYQRAYFGVTPAASLATGLPVYRPNGGVHALAVASGLSYQFSDRWGMFGFARYERLVGKAGRSPIVRTYGSRNQLSAGLGLNYTFRTTRS